MSKTDSFGTGFGYGYGFSFSASWPTQFHLQPKQKTMY